MGRDYTLYEELNMMNWSLPVIFKKHILSYQSSFPCHWHEKIELLYFIKGSALVRCNSNEFEVKKGDLVVVNSNEFHQAWCLTETTEYYCIIFDMSLLQARHVDACEAKYINPIAQNHILLQNKIENNQIIAGYIAEFASEFEARETGYEIAIKACIYRLMVLLLRNHVQSVLRPREYEIRVKNMDRLNKVLEYMEFHFNEKITIDQLCAMINVSRFHFCRMFKEVTNKSPGEYLNILRINKACEFLSNSEVNVSEAAMAVGFNDLNYFSRIFRKYKNVPPSSLKNKNL